MPSKDDDQTPRTGERIAKMLARAGIASRREVERMIDDGRVAIDGVAITTPATILTSLAGVAVDGRPVAAPEEARLFVYHKPTGLLVTERDPAGRPTIYDRLPGGLPRLVPVGRLDLNTEGLLLLTTDGGLKRKLELPANGVERTYRARVYGHITQPELETLMDGIEIDGIRYGAIDANLERRTGTNAWIELTLTEGKNREVRRVLEYLGLQVGRLIRTRYGPFILADMPVGTIGEVHSGDIAHFEYQLARKQKPDALIAVLPMQNPPRARLGEGDHSAQSNGGGAGAPRAARGTRTPSHGDRSFPARGDRPSSARGPRPSTSSGRTEQERATRGERSPAARPGHSPTARPGHPSSVRAGHTSSVRPELVEGPVQQRLPRGSQPSSAARTATSAPRQQVDRAPQRPTRDGRAQPAAKRGDYVEGRPTGDAPTPRPPRPQRKPGWARAKPKAGPGKPRK
ncbi:23S rRNA pseudouridine2605 synthase [Sphingomonas jinjuensis]|uniref:Pseudouridine synthase n=1 Tax=Sphingomonas jinjuensis TaxID=535907 RepID=A0A840F8Q9_9SPHN|nr:pseudouridine synthase [Sphingomonas jinjuensis]MBB4152941.1 23S rRNA pseudouridine2605 synthase [Sphingomonas jinjuensis]